VRLRGRFLPDELPNIVAANNAGGSRKPLGRKGKAR